MDLSVYLNPTFADNVPFPERVVRLADMGVDAVEIGLWGVSDLDRLVAVTEDHGVDIAYMSGAVGPTNDPDAVDDRIAEAEEAIDRAAEIGCPNLNVSPGQALDDYDRVTQQEAVVEVLDAIAPTAESAGVTLLIEPLNTRVDHPSTFLSSSYEGYKILNAVDSPAAKLLFDVYHQQITEGDIVRSIRAHTDHIGHVHVADNPGRHEPGTGEIDYEFVIDALDASDYDGYLGCEFTPTGDPGNAVEYVRSQIS